MRTLFFIVTVLSSLQTIAQNEVETIIQRGHHGQVSTVTYSHNGKYIASGGMDKTIRIWEVATGHELRVITGHQYTVRSLQFSKDDKYLISGSNDSKTLIWDATTGKLIKELVGTGDRVTTAAMSKDGSWYLAGGYDWDAYLWKKDSANYTKKFKVNPAKGTGEGLDVDFSNDSKYFALGQDNYTAEVYSLDDLSKVTKLRPVDNGSCGGCPTQVSFSRNNDFLYTAASKMGIYKWDFKSGTIAKKFVEGKERIGFFKVHEEAGLIAYGYEKELFILKLSSGNQIKKFDLDTVHINEISFNPSGTELALATSENTIMIYSTDTWKLQSELRGLVNDEAESGLTYDKNSMWDRWILTYIKLKSSLSMSPDGNFLARGKVGRKVRLLELRTGRVAKEFIGHEKVVITTNFSPDGKRLLSGGADGEIYVWDIITGKSVMKLSGHRDPVFDVRYNSKGDKIISSGWDGTIRIWDARTGDQIKKINLGQKASISVQFAINDLYIISANLDGKVCVYEFDTGEEVVSLTGHSDKVQSLMLSKDGNKVLTSSWDGLSKIWDIRSGFQEVRFGLHKDKVHVAAYNQHGDKVASGSGDGTIYIWNAATGDSIYKLEGHKSEVNSMLFSKDDKYLISGSVDGEIKIWDMANRTEILSHYSVGESDWLVTTPQGLFDATQNAKNYIFFVQGMESFSIDQFFEEFYQPDLIQHLFAGIDMNIKDRSIRDRMIEFPPPEIELVSPKPGTQMKLGKNDMMIRFSDIGGGLDEIKVMHNGKRIETDSKGLGRSPKKGNVTNKLVTIEIVPGPNTIAISAFSKGRVESRPILLNYNIESKEKKGKCYALVVGLNKYQNSKLNLNYAKDDADIFVKTLKEETKGLFTATEVLEVYNEEANKKNILSKLDEIALNASPHDVFIFYYAGHGSMIDQDFYFITNEITRLYDEELLKKEALSAYEVQEVFTHIKALKQVVVLDACHSGGSAQLLATRGGSEEKAIAQLSRSTGVHVFASAGSEQFATEFKQLGHGVFTYLLVEAMKGGADGAPNDGKVTIFELKSYLDSKVPELSEELKGTAQYPYTFSIGNDFPVSLPKK